MSLKRISITHREGSLLRVLSIATETSVDQRTALWWLAPLILAGFGLRTLGLDAQSLWWDEAFSLNLASQPLPAIIRGDFHPPLYHVLLGGWIRLVGDSAFAARFLSVVCGTLLLPLAYQLGCRLFDPPTGYVAALLAGLSPVLLWYTQETRMYILVTLFYLLLVWLFHRLIDSDATPPSRRLWLAFALVELAGLYTHYFFALGVAWLLLSLFLRTFRDVPASRQPAFLTALISSQLLVALLYLPWIPIFFSLQAQYHPVGATPPTLRSFFDQVWHGYHAGSLALVGHHTLFMRLSTATILLLTLALPIALLIDRRRSGLLWLLGHTLVPLAAIFLAMQIRPFFHPRYVVMLVSPLLILYARLITVTIQHKSRFWTLANSGTMQEAPQKPGFSTHKSGWVGYAGGMVDRTKSLLLGRKKPGFYNFAKLQSRVMPVLGGILFLAILLSAATAIQATMTDPRYQRDDIRGLAHLLTIQTTPQDAVVFGYLDHAFRYYYQGPARPIFLNLDRADQQVAEALASQLRDRERAFLVTWNQAPVDRRGLVRWLLTAAGRQTASQPWGDLNIFTYALDRAVPRPHLTSYAADFGVLRLVAHQLPTTMPAAGAIPVALTWTSQQSPSADYKIGLRLYDAAGHPWSQADIPIVNPQGDPTSRWAPGTSTTLYAVLPLLQGTPPGTYTISLVVYDGLSLRPLERKDLPGQQVPLGTVTLTPTSLPFQATTRLPLTPVNRSLGPLTLAGFTLNRSEAGPGGQLSVALQWSVTGSPPASAPVLRLMAADKPLTTASPPLYPVTAWQPGQIILDWRDLTVPPTAPAGPATLEISTTNATLPLTTIQITEVDHRFEPPAMAYTYPIRFGDVAELLGYDLQTTVKADQPVELTLYWKALRASDISYTVFTHLLNDAGQLVGQHDGIPVSGQRPTTGWLADEIIVDHHPMAFKEAGYTGTVQVEIGLYDPVTGQRVLTETNADHVILPTPIQVQP